MRSFFTFLSLFTLLFFLAPILCLGIPIESGEAPPPLQIPEQILQGGEHVATADLILGALGAMDVRGYHAEALKAAAVVAATQVATRYRETGCGDGIATVTPQQAKEAWGDYWFSQYWPQMQAAVRETWGEILTNANGDVFEASVFRLSWGKTEIGVECPLDETAEGYESTVRVPLQEFVAVFPEYASSFSVKNAQSGRVETVTSGKTKLSGSEVMQRFPLPRLYGLHHLNGGNLSMPRTGKRSRDVVVRSQRTGKARCGLSGNSQGILPRRKASGDKSRIGIQINAVS